jgi:hypothetical protein
VLPPLEKPLCEGLAQIVGQPVDLDQLGQQLLAPKITPVAPGPSPSISGR